MSGMRSGRPRVLVGSSVHPYDTSGVLEALAKLKTEQGEPHEAGDMPMPMHGSTGQLERMLGDYARTGSIPVRLKDPTTSDFRPGVEDSKMWGDTFSASWVPGPGGAVGPPNPVLNVKVNRNRPTTFNIMTNLTLIGTVWGTETTPSQLVMIYSIGVGQAKAQVLRFIPFTPSAMSSISVPPITLRSIQDVFTSPLQSFIVQAFIFLPVVVANQSADHAFSVTTLAAPQVT